MFATCTLLGDLVNVHDNETAIFMKNMIALSFNTLADRKMPVSV